jgi:4-diphosphocytidyl-2-C-methyl-D-erythritol kinase
MVPSLARFAPAKINLFLEVRGRRQDGYHEIDTVMETVAAGDLVEAFPSSRLEVVADRPDVPSGPDNVAHRIVRAAESALGRALPAHVRITKKIPPGSGLGAGSSDAVAALLLVLELHGIRLPVGRLEALAAAVGSDTAFFVRGGIARCTGRGEIVSPLPAAGVRHVVLVLPEAACATASVYSALEPAFQPRDPEPLLAALRSGSTLAPPAGADLVFNRLAAAAERAYPRLAARRLELARAAGRAPSLSGSGGTFFFLSESLAEARALGARLRAASPALDVRETASYRGDPARGGS